MKQYKGGRSIKGKPGFTLIELVVVIIIIGILASIGLPIYTNLTEKSRCAEALTGLKVVYDAQVRRALEFTTPAGANGDRVNVVAGLDANITDPGRYFQFFIGDATYPLTSATNYVVYANRINANPAWGFRINELGNFSGCGTGYPSFNF